ncbi:uncharacterized protein LOC144018554 [Festucalex cinctus]
MAKRHANDALFFQSPAKRTFRSLYSVVDLQLESMAVYGGLSPTCTLALLSDRCRKRRRSLEIPDVPQEEAQLYLKATNPDTHKENMSPAQTCDSTTARKRRREESVESGTDAATVYDKTDADSEDCIYNSFQYWRIPLPEVDLSLLEETTEHCQIKHNSIVRNASDAMET